MKKDIDIHEALDLAKKLLKTTRVRVSVGRPTFSCMNVPASLPGSSYRAIFVMESFSAEHASSPEHACWNCLAVAKSWEEALVMVEEDMKTVDGIIACRKADARDGVRT